MLKYRMNYLDLLPDDVLGIINKQVKDDYIITRRLERKENRRLNREQEKKAYRRGILFERFVNFYRRLLEAKYRKKIQNHLEFDYLRRRISDIVLFNKGGGRHEYEYSIINLILEGWVIIE